jgi:hypothetical protein
MKIYEFFFKGAKLIKGVASVIDQGASAAKSTKAIKAVTNVATTTVNTSKAIKAAANATKNADELLALAKTLKGADAVAMTAKAGRAADAASKLRKIADGKVLSKGADGLNVIAKNSKKLETLKSGLKNTSKTSKGAKSILSKARRGALKFVKNHPMLITFGLTAAGIAIYADTQGISFEQALKDIISKPIEFVQDVADSVNKNKGDVPEPPETPDSESDPTDEDYDPEADPDAYTDEDLDFEEEGNFESGFSDFADKLGVSPDNLTYIFIGILFFIVLILLLKKKKVPPSA